jgi:hypothetical protein
MNNQTLKMDYLKRYSFDEMKSALEKWLSPEDESEEVVAAPVAAKSTSNFSLDTTKAKQSKVDEFDSLFDSKEGKTDDLPF